MSRKRKNGNNGNINPIQTNSKQVHKELKPKTENQADYIRAMIESHITICAGPAGTGKTACAVGLACEHLVQEKIEQIIVTRPVIETGRQGLGYLPGDIATKMHPYIIPVVEELDIYLGKVRRELFMTNGKIKIEPLEYMRGRNFHQSFIILDEAQNATIKQVKMLLSRIGRGSTVVLTGDTDQSDLFEDTMGLKLCLDRLPNTRGVSIINLTTDDIVRHDIIARVLEKLK